MAQTPAVTRQNNGTLDYTPGSAVATGDVVVLGSIVGIATKAIAASTQGALAIEGIYELPKITGTIAVGTKVYWDPSGNPLNGTAGSGAITSTAGSLKCAGYAVAASSGNTIDVVLSRA